MKALIEKAYAENLLGADVQEAVEHTIQQLDSGAIRVCEKATEKVTEKVDEKTGSNFMHHEWIKKAILLYFRLRKMSVFEAGDFRFVDKVPVKKWTGNEGVRVVPQAMVRYGSFVSSGAILMPSFVNIGAFIGSGTMVDTWATVGSCAYVGAGVHLSGGVGVGGVLEPVQAKPVVIEDGAFIGSRCILVEGVHIEEGAVLGAGVTITGSTKIIDASSGTVHKGRVPKNAVVIPGTYQKQFNSGIYGVPCALIIGSRKESTNQKTSLTDALREYDVAT